MVPTVLLSRDLSFPIPLFEGIPHLPSARLVYRSPVGRLAAPDLQPGILVVPSACVLRVIRCDYDCYHVCYFVEPYIQGVVFTAPLIFILTKNTAKQPTLLVKAMQVVLWEIPLLAWIYASHALGWRALEVS